MPYEQHSTEPYYLLPTTYYLLRRFSFATATLRETRTVPSREWGVGGCGEEAIQVRVTVAL